MEKVVDGTYELLQLGKYLLLDCIEITTEDIFGVDHRKENFHSCLAHLIMARQAQSEDLLSEAGKAGLILTL